MTDTKTLASALLAAQKALPSVGKDAKNSFHHYAYVSAEAMIGACREALHGAGLTARRAGWKFDGSPEGGIVYSTFVVTHGSTGESITDEIAWVCVPEKGRPIDKSLAGCLTSSLNYWLRDLLLVPREDESEMDRRDDTKYEPRKAAPAPARPAPRPEAQHAPQAAPATKATPTPPKAKEPATAAPSAFGEVLASRPAKDCVWHDGLTVKRVGQGKPTAKGSMRYPILLEVGGSEQWASCFDDKVMQAAQDAMGGESVEAFIQEGQYGWTLYGIRTTLESANQQPAPIAVEADEIPF